jgi:hypothetical protein
MRLWRGRALGLGSRRRWLESFRTTDRGGRAGEKESNPRWLKPVSVIIQVGIDAGGANDYIGGLEGQVLGGFENALEDTAEFPFSPDEEAGRVHVAIDGGAVGDFVILGYQFGAAPTDEIAFDGVAVRVEADGASTGVAGEIRRKALRSPRSGFLRVNGSRGDRRGRGFGRTGGDGVGWLVGLVGHVGGLGRLARLKGFLESLPLVCVVHLKVAWAEPSGLGDCESDWESSFSSFHFAHPPVMAGDKAPRRFDRGANNALRPEPCGTGQADPP